MIACAILSAILASLQAMTIIHLENPLITVAFGLSYLIVSCFAIDREDKLLRRITKLEEKLKRYEGEEQNNDRE